jgi:rubrerythrin
MVRNVESVDREETTDYVEFWAAGQRAKGEFHCAQCGYGVTVYTQLPTCPMCASGSWEQTAWSPFAGRLGEPAL